MNDLGKFDELARRKLEERVFPFDPQAWADMERMLPPRPERRMRKWPLLALILLLPLAGGLWYTWDRKAPVPGPDKAAPMVAVPPARSSATPPGAGGAPLAHEASSATPPRILPDEPPSAPAGRMPAAGEAAQKPAAFAAAPGTRPATQAPPRNGPFRDAHAPADKPLAAAPAVGLQRPLVPAVNQPKDNRPADPETAKEGGLSMDTPEQPAVSAPGTSTAPAQGTPESVAAAPQNHDADRPADTSGIHIHAMDPAVDSAAVKPSLAIDSLAAAASADSLSTAPPPLPAHPQWELAAWAGAFNTATRYTGGRTMDWASDHAARNTIGCGAELVRMHGHFGYGSGLHYITYAEQVEAPGLSDTHTGIVWSHQLVGIDTSINVAHGTTVINGQAYYVTTNVDTTLLVLVSTAEEETITTVRRSALERTNRTSYLEIPLLLDAHIGTGRWLFGLRGGPSLGVLQGRRGQLPGATGYTDLRDEAFHELVPGWSVRGYVRYRLGQAWSIGAGPSARGQVGNTLQGDGLARRSTAWGGMVGISYRLP